jgi:hypothetical protein
MSDAPDRLPPEIDAFLSPERRRPDPPAELQSQVLSRLGATLGWLGGPGRGPGGSDPSGGAAPGGHGAGGFAAHGAKQLAAGSLVKTVAALVVGVVTGAGGHEMYDRATERRARHAAVAVVAPPVAPEPLPGPPPIAKPTLEPAAPIAARAEPTSVKPSDTARVEPRQRDRSLAAERALIEQAQTALAREQGAAALAVLERHARDFPQGELAEERDSLQVQALVKMERYEQARKAAAHFHGRFPRSIFGAMVDEALKSIP